MTGEKSINNSVLFICAANQCRSPMAMVLFKDFIAKIGENLESWRIESAGLWAVSGYPATKDAAHVISEMGLDLSNHQSQPITESLLKGFNLILCMEREQSSFIKRNFPTAMNKVFFLSEMADQDQDIIDPYGSAQNTYSSTANEILYFLQKGYLKILKLSK